jgi:probable O-glycosylation ligase (exosortase A-associated)
VIRTLIVLVLFIAGWSFAFQSPVYAAGLYLWIAYFRPESWAWSDIFATLNLSYFAGAFLLVRTLFSSVRLRFDFRNSMLLLFLAQGLVASLAGPNLAYSLDLWQEFLKTIVISYLLSILITTTAEFRVIVMVIVLSLGYEAGTQGWLRLIFSPGAPNANPVPFLGDNNFVAVGMAMLLPMVGALAATATGWRRRAFQFLSVGVTYRAISTYSRGGLLSVGVVGIMSFWRSQHKMRAAVAFVVVLLVVLPALPPAYWDRMATITASSEDRDESQQGRIHFWRVGFEMANQRPLVGVGHMGFSPAYDTYDFSLGAYGSGRAVHSAWFGVLAEYGYPGFLLFIAIVGSSLWACRRIRKSSQRGEISGELGQYATGLESALLAFMVGGSFVSFHYTEMLWHFLALTMALETVAATEAASATTRGAAATIEPLPVQPATRPQEPDFVWG